MSQELDNIVVFEELVSAPSAAFFSIQVEHCRASFFILTILRF